MTSGGDITVTYAGGHEKGNMGLKWPYPRYILRLFGICDWSSTCLKRDYEVINDGQLLRTSRSDLWTKDAGLKFNDFRRPSWSCREVQKDTKIRGPENYFFSQQDEYVYIIIYIYISIYTDIHISLSLNQNT